VTKVSSSIFDYLKDLEAAAGQISDTWRPDDPAYQAERYRQIMMNLSYAYFAYFHADAEHPDWAPLWNPVYTDQPNPDDIYLYSPIRGDRTYKVSGQRGTTSLLTFTIQHGWVGMIDNLGDVTHAMDVDHRGMTVGPNGEFEVIFSAVRPKDWTGNWVQIAEDADCLVVRYRMVDWEKEVDPQLSIEHLEPAPPKPRLTPEQILHRVQEMARLPWRYNRAFDAIQNGVREQVGTNVFVHHRYQAGLSQQVYWPAIFELDDGEALIIETDMPKVRTYWNIQLNDPIFNAVEYVYRLSSLNAWNATISSDGKLRAVIALEDPGVPNWMDPAGFKEGTIYGRWYNCNTEPMPVIKRVKLAELRKHLPADTPAVTPEQRADELRRRVRAAQRRRRW
jgi:hypothetical protein